MVTASLMRASRPAAETRSAPPTCFPRANFLSSCPRWTARLGRLQVSVLARHLVEFLHYYDMPEITFAKDLQWMRPRVVPASFLRQAMWVCADSLQPCHWNSPKLLFLAEPLQNCCGA